MKYWIIIFTPETYKLVKSLEKIGVRNSARKRFFSAISEGDRFIAYISREMVFDGIGTIVSDAFGEETFDFSEERLFPWRRRVSFEKTGTKTSTAGLFKNIPPFNRVNTVPGNYLTCKGGFVEISKSDFEQLTRTMKKSGD